MIINNLAARLSVKEKNFYGEICRVVDNCDRFSPVIPNNGRFIVIPKASDLNSFLNERLASDFSDLNALNINIVTCCRNFVEREVAQSPKSEHVARLSGLVADWQYKSDSGLHYLGPGYADLFFSSPHFGVGALRSKLAKKFNPIFARMASILRDALRIKIYIPVYDLNAFQKLIFRLDQDDPDLFNRIGRYEFAPPHETFALNIYASLTIQVDDPKSIDVSQLLAVLLSWYAKTHSETPTPRWMQEVCPGISLGQGFSGYKDYLHCLGILANYYSEQTGFAIRSETVDT